MSVLRSGWQQWQLRHAHFCSAETAELSNAPAVTADCRIGIDMVHSTELGGAQTTSQPVALYVTWLLELRDEWRI